MTPALRFARGVVIQCDLGWRGHSWTSWRGRKSDRSATQVRKFGVGKSG